MLLLHRWLLFTVLQLPVNTPAYQKQASPQGVAGYVYQHRGNQMPRYGGNKAVPKGIPAEIKIYPAIKITDVRHKGAIFTELPGRPAASGLSDSSGRYRIGLPPGSYSVFIKTNGGWYAGETDGEGYANHILVSKSAWVIRNFTVNKTAYY